MNEQKPTSKSSRLLNYVISFVVLFVWMIMCFMKKELIDMHLSLVVLIIGAMFGRAGIEFVQTVSPNIMNKHS
jgi:hypothetical protein